MMLGNFWKSSQKIKFVFIKEAQFGFLCGADFGILFGMPGLYILNMLDF